MSAMLHPVGPEPTQTYWLRRVVVSVAAVLALVLLAVAVANATSSGSATSTPPPGAVPVQVPVSASPTASVSRISPTPIARPSNQTSPPAPVPPSSVPTQSVRASATAVAPTKPGTPAPPEPPSPSARPSTSTPVVRCDPAQLRVTLTGRKTLKPRQPTAFALSVVNGGADTCEFTVGRDNFELRIFSGRDRIWSTRDCASAVAERTFALVSQEAHRWNLTWNGRRSRADCKVRPEIPRPGTYVVTADLDGTKTVELRMQLRG